MSHRGKYTLLSCAIALVFAIALLASGTAFAQDGEGGARQSRGKISRVPAQPLDWPLPPGVDKSYDSVDGKKLHRYVEELAAISEKYRDAGNQWWGRIPGMASGLEAQNWAKEKFKEIGVPTEIVNIPDPQTLPKSWDLSISANGKTLKLQSSQPTIDFATFEPDMKGDIELDTVWVGLGQA